MRHSGKRGRTGQIRDLSHQTDNRDKVTKELGAVADALRERKSILKFKQSPPQGKRPPSLSQPVPLISSKSRQVHINLLLLQGPGFCVFVFCNPYRWQLACCVSWGEEARASTACNLPGRPETGGQPGPQLRQLCEEAGCREAEGQSGDPQGHRPSDGRYQPRFRRRRENERKGLRREGPQRPHQLP